MKKFLSLLTALTLLVGMLSSFSVSADVNSTTFFNAENGNQIAVLDNVDSLYATTTFTGRYEDNASVIVAHYNADGKLIAVESIVPVESTIGESVTYTTPEISVADTGILKVFAWTGVDSIKPLLKFPGIISRVNEIVPPTATVSELNVNDITDVALTFAMNFKADPATEAQLLAYGTWYADYVLTVNKDVTFNLDGTKDGYLAGQYDSWSPAWVAVPKKDVTVAAGTPVKIMETAAETYGEPGLKYTYAEVYDRVKDFDCGVFFTDEFLAANPDLKVTLELRMYNPLNEAEYYSIAGPYTFPKRYVTQNAQVLTSGNVTAEVPAGVMLEEGVTELTLTTTALESSESGVEAGENETLSAMDIHVEGVSSDNTTPIIVTITEATETGYNKGNLSLYHVEDGEAVSMEEVETKEDLVAHNQFTYDPADGTIAVAMATFSEVAVVAEIGKEWNGEFDYTWYVGKESPYTIANADQLAGFGAIVGGMDGQTRDSFNGKTIKLISDINIADDEEHNDPDKIFYPIGYYSDDGLYEKTGVAITSGFKTFEGIFDGNGHTIKNIYQNTWEMKGDHDWYTPEEQYFRDGMGIFGKVKGATIKNLTVDNFSCDGEITTTGVIAAYADSAEGKPITFENIAITNCNPRVYNIGNGGIVGSGGWYSKSAEEDLNKENSDEYPNAITFKNITVDNTNKISALWGSWDVACAGIMGRYYPDSKCGVKFENCHVAAQIDVYNDVCGNYQYYWYRYAGMMIGTVQASTTDDDGYTVPDMTGITAVGCTVHFGEWNDYYYCELVANSLASYTHDHQFSRLEQIASLDEIKSGDTWLKTGNFLLIEGDTKTCYHIVEKDGVLTQHNHEDSDYEDGIDEDGDGENDLKEDKQIVYLPFNQLFQGSGWGVKNIPIYDDDQTHFAGITILDREVADSVTKFEEADTVEESYTTGTTVTVGDLFKAVEGCEVGIVGNNVQVTVSPVDENDTVSAEYTANTSNWEDGTLTFSGTGKANITITDYYFCIPTTITVTVEELVQEPIQKFNATNVSFAYDLTTIESGIKTTLGALFTAAEGLVIESSAVDVTVDGNAQVTVDTNDWTQSAVVLNGTDKITITITDNDFCIPTSVAITVAEPANVEKWDATETTITHAVVGGTTTVNVSDIFTEKEDVVIKAAEVCVTGNNSDVSVGHTKGEATFTLTGVGVVELTITDNFYCTATTVSITVNQPVEKFNKEFYSENYMYRVGNVGTVEVGKLFSAKDGAEISNNVTVTVTPVDGTGATGTYTENATWTKGTIQFSRTGVVKVSITDNNYCVPTELYLEVVDATNVTTATNATDKNIVLLNDAGFSSLTVSDGYTLYGNGFTLTYTGNGQYLGKGSGFKFGVVNVSDGGTLENARINCSIYPISALYSDQIENYYETDSSGKTRYFYQLSAVAVSGDSTISNCYIYGARSNVCVGAGNVTIKDSILECGAVANVHVVSTNEYTVTLKDVTTIQYQTKPTTYANDNLKNKIMLGFGVLVGQGETGETNPNIVLSGEFKQYNWVCSDDASAVSDSYAQKAINGALGTTAYQHIINGKTYANMGIVYLNNAASTVENNTDSPYKQGTIKIDLVTGQAYSLSGATENQIYFDYEKADKSTENDLYKPQFKFTDKLGGQYVAKTDDGDEFCYQDGKTVKIMFPSGDTKAINLASMVNIAKYSGQDLNLNITCVDEDGNPVAVDNGIVNLSLAGEYTVTYSVTDTVFFDKEGNPVENTIPYTFQIVLSVSLKDNSLPNAYFEFNADEQVIYRSGNSNIVQFIPFLRGLKIYDYNKQDAPYLRFDGTNDFNKIAKASIENINTTGEAQGYHIVTVELTDGGKLVIDMDVRATSGSSTHSGSIKVRNNELYVVNGGTTSGKGQIWRIYSYKFVGNNGFEINSGAVTFGTDGVDCDAATKPSSNFGTTIKYTVSYDANGGDCGQTIGYATSASAAVTLPTPRRTGSYNFVGWYTASSGGTLVGGAGDSYTPTANITLYAQWGKSGTITYNANGGSCDTASVYYDGTAITLPTAVRDGYWFVGWYDAPEGGNKIGDAGLSYHGDGDMTMYAHWQEKVEYTVTYDANGGSCGTASATYQGTALTLPTPTKTGHDFNGWYTQASGGTKIGDAGASYIPSANITLYAQWIINSYDITVKTTNATVKVNGTAVNNNSTISIQYGTQVTVEVTYNESNSQSTTIKGSDGTNYTSPFTMPAQKVTIEATSSSCVTPDTLITLADGSKVRVDSLAGDEELLVWNLETGSLDSAPIMFLDSEEEAEFEIVHLYFSDGTDVKVIYEHGFWDYDLNRYVYLDENASDYIGHTFAKQNGDTLEQVQLTDVVVETEVTTAWSPVTKGHLCYFVNDMLSMPGGVGGLFNIFEVDPETMTYDYAKMAEDIETYGLYTYEEMNAFAPLSEAMFNEAGGAYLKVSIGKGNLTLEELKAMINRYSKFFE